MSTLDAKAQAYREVEADLEAQVRTWAAKLRAVGLDIPVVSLFEYMRDVLFFYCVDEAGNAFEAAIVQPEFEI